MKIPKKYTDLVGTKQTFGDWLFGQSEKLELMEYNVLKIRWATAKIFDFDKGKYIHPTIQFLLKREGMKRAQWTQPFGVYEIELKEEE